MNFARIALLIGALAPVAASAVPNYDITASDRGWYRQDGDHTTSNQNIITGYNGNSFSYRNWAFFDLSAAAGQTVTSANLIFAAGNGEARSNDANETYTVFDYTGSLTTLLNGTAGVAAFNDLGTGASFGSAVVATTNGLNGNPMPEVNISLNAAALAAINAVLTGISYDFALGGALTSLAGNPDVQTLWSSSNNNVPNAIRLTLTTEPVDPPAQVPVASPLLLIGFGAMGLYLRRRQQK